MHRRNFIRTGLALGCSPALLPSAAAATPSDELIIDAHAHAGHGAKFGQPDAAPWETFNDPEWLLRLAAEAGIRKSVIFPINNPTYEQANREIAGYVRQHPDRLIGFAKHDGVTEAGRIRELLTREVRELGLRGLKLHGVPTTEMCETAAELEIPILMHPPRVGPCEAVVGSFPRVNFILAHLGSFGSRDWREHRLAFDLVRRFPNLHLETSSNVFFPFLEEAARELPAEKLIFGSDGPLVDPRVELHKIRLLRLPPEKSRLVLAGNITRLLGGKV